MILALLALSVVVFSGPLFAQSDLPPPPRAKPLVALLVIPPRPKPVQFAPVIAAGLALPRALPAPAAPPPALPAGPPECEQLLSHSGTAYVQLASVGRSGSCGIEVPLELSALDGIALKPTATLNCRTAAAFDYWIATVMRPAARQFLGSEPLTITIAASYDCRGRNRVPGARLSEHAFGNAVDVSKIAFADGRLFQVGARRGAFDPEARFEAAIRAGACGPFTTVLGPGSDAYHHDHLHMDTAQRRNGSRWCR